MPDLDYDPDKPSTFTEPRKCHGCGWYFDLTREGLDEADPLRPSGEDEDRIVLCGDCRDEAADEAAEMAKNFARLIFHRAGAR